MNIAYFGTSEKATSVLKTLLEHSVRNNDIKVTLVITKEGSEIETLAKEYNIRTLTPGKNMASVAGELLTERIDLGVVADFGMIIPPNIINTPKSGLINIHTSLLPKYRGASPAQHMILKGDKVAGVTFQLVDEGMDTGDILFQTNVQLTGSETAGELYKSLFELAAQHIIDVVRRYVDGDLKPMKQHESDATYCYSPTHSKSTFVYKEDAKINWRNTPAEIERMTRAYRPWPVAWTTLMELQEAELIKLKDPNKGKLVLKVFSGSVINDVFVPNEVQLEGKKITDWESFLNGYSVK